MNYIKTIIIFSSFIFLLFACEKQSIENIETKTAVVEGYLYDGQPVDSLKITQSFSYSQLDTNVISLDGLDVILSESANQYPLTSIGNGIYQNSQVFIEQDKSYRLEFVWEGETISAETYIPLKKEAQLSLTEVELPKVELGSNGSGVITGTLDPVEITWNNSEGDYYYIVITNIESDPEYVNENVAANIAANGGAPRFVFITEPQISDFYAVNARRELTQYGTHQIIVFRVNPEYAALYESSGNSTLSLEQPPTNIENGLGIFTGVSSDTLYLEVNKI